MSHYAPLPRRSVALSAGAARRMLGGDELPVSLIRPGGTPAAPARPAPSAASPAIGEPSAEGAPPREDQPAEMRRQLLAEIEAALCADDAEIACFHVTLATIWAKRLVALGSVAAASPAAADDTEAGAEKGKKCAGAAQSGRPT